MKWMLVAVIAWADTPPLSSLQIPMETEELCENASKLLSSDLSAAAAGTAVGMPVTGRLSRESGVITTCIKIAE